MLFNAATTIGVILAAFGYYAAVRHARRTHWTARALRTLSALSGLALVAMVLTDWPGESLARFWADHSVLAAVVSTLLLVSLGYLAFEAGEKAEQAELDRSVTAAGLSGIVDHLVDIDIALALLSSERPPAEYEHSGRPLRWIRPIRERLQNSTDSPPFEAESSTQPPAEAWRQDLVDQCVRRLMAGMRDWAALIGVSDDGRTVLKRLGEIRIALLKMPIAAGAKNDDLVRRLRCHVQQFAMGLEKLGSPTMRPGLTAFLPGGLSPQEVTVASDRTMSQPEFLDWSTSASKELRKAFS